MSFSASLRENSYGRNSSLRLGVSARELLKPRHFTDNGRKSSLLCARPVSVVK